MIKIVSKDIKELCNEIFEITKGLVEDITLLELEREYIEYYSKDNSIIS